MSLIFFSSAIGHALTVNAREIKRRAGRPSLDESTTEESTSKMPRTAPDLAPTPEDVKLDGFCHRPIQREDRPRCCILSNVRLETLLN